jgi:hypothetical protein
LSGIAVVVVTAALEMGAKSYGMGCSPIKNINNVYRGQTLLRGEGVWISHGKEAANFNKPTIRTKAIVAVLSKGENIMDLLS